MSDRNEPTGVDRSLQNIVRASTYGDYIQPALTVRRSVNALLLVGGACIDPLIGTASVAAVLLLDNHLSPRVDKITRAQEDFVEKHWAQFTVLEQFQALKKRLRAGRSDFCENGTMRQFEKDNVPPELKRAMLKSARFSGIRSTVLGTGYDVAVRSVRKLFSLDH